ncbi:MAG: excinuclease ABC subunit UvrA [Chitinophagales bacterium]|nr:excinuclease ABC subunit UvrA [Bacteroidota bacterium]MCB9042202.1 excinuclease ABC subunit UvrA [Chitinophagales bacterium]
MSNNKYAQLKSEIFIKGARLHNLKDVSVSLPRNSFIVLTGVSGSGKSSLAMDTLFAEGQRRYVESLSSYARQFLQRMNKPDVDYIQGLCPAIAIDQHSSNRNARSSVGTLTEIYDYLRLLFARVGTTFSPISGQKVEKQQVTDVVDYLCDLPIDTRVQILCPFIHTADRSLAQNVEILLQKGFSRLVYQNKTLRIAEEVLPNIADFTDTEALFLLIDRLVIPAEKEDYFLSRAADSVQTAFNESGGFCIVHFPDSAEKTFFSNRFEADGMQFEEPSDAFFNFNNSYGACKTCEGLGSIIGIDEDLVIPNKNLSVYEGAVAAWSGEKMSLWKDNFIAQAAKYNFPIHKPIRLLSEQEYNLLWKGNKEIEGIDDFFAMVEQNLYKIHYRILLARYRGRTVCKDCQGTRLRKDAHYVKINDKSIIDLLLLPLDALQDFFKNLSLNPQKTKIAARILIEINNRLEFLIHLGLPYLNLNRSAASLSGGESQRIQLTRSLGSNLTQSLYILDEPSIGLHPRDTQKLIEMLKKLQALGNTVVVVEHEEDIIRQADYLVDMGPLAGHLGGEVVFAGAAKAIEKCEESLTGKYLTQVLEIPVPAQRRKFTNKIQLKGVYQHNLKNIDVTFPLNTLTVVSGVSGSGKTSLVLEVLYPAVQQHLGNAAPKLGKFAEISGDLRAVSQIEMVDQNPIGRSSRSNAVTYVKAYDHIRDIFCQQKLAKVRGYKAKHFSFNTEGGRCETCKGDGEVVVEMQFLADVHLVCDDCKGKRFKDEILEVQYKGKSISDVLNMTIAEAYDFFKDIKNIEQSLAPLVEVGLGYLQVGQASSTLSGGEAQRLKLASFLGQSSRQKGIVFIFDEPTTGLHFHDIYILLKAFEALIDKGHTVILIEHNLDVIKYADWVIDIGPEGGAEGGHLMFQGTPEDLCKVENSHTATFLREKMK